MKMNKQELMTNVNEILDKHFGNTIFTDPVLSITKSAKDNRVLMELEFEQGGIVLEKELFKLKDVIARIKKLDLGTQKVWLNEILNKLGSDYGSLKYRAGYEQGKFDCAMERDKVTVQQFVADWYEEYKDDFEGELFRCVDLITRDFEDGDLSEFEEWFIDGKTKPFQTLVNMHQFGYEVEKEKRYTVKMRTTNQPLFYNSLEKRLFFSLGKLATQFTFKQLEEAGFREVFNSPLFEVEEVEE